MNSVLIVTLIAVLVVLTAAVVPLLIQLRRTALAVERFAESATLDLKRVAEDVHATRVQVEGLVGRFQPSPSGGAMDGLLGFLQGGSLGRFAPLLTGLIGLISMFLAPKAKSGGSDEQ